MKSRLLAILLLLSAALAAAALCAETAFTELWSGFSTSLTNRSQQQRRNAELAGQMLNGTIIPPGGTISFNEIVGARDLAKGFVAAPNLNASGMLDDVPGGGICQLASTIYNAALLGGLKIVERHPHSRTVGHVPPGRDATIASWRKDLKLANPFTHPLMLTIDSRNDRLTASLRSPVSKPFRIRIVTEQIAVEPETVASRERQGQPGLTGFSTRTMRLVQQNGHETKEFISEDFYPAPSRILAAP